MPDMFNYGGFGTGGGYNDPLGSGRGRPGMGQFFMQGGPPIPNGMDLGHKIPPKSITTGMVQGNIPGAGFLGGIKKGFGDFIMGNEGANLANVIGAGASIYGVHKQAQEAERMREAEEEREREERERYDSWDPQRAAIMERLMARRGQ